MSGGGAVQAFVFSRSPRARGLDKMPEPFRRMVRSRIGQEEPLIRHRVAPRLQAGNKPAPPSEVMPIAAGIAP